MFSRYFANRYFPTRYFPEGLVGVGGGYYPGRYFQCGYFARRYFARQTDCAIVLEEIVSGASGGAIIDWSLPRRRWIDREDEELLFIIDD